MSKAVRYLLASPLIVLLGCSPPSASREPVATPSKPQAATASVEYSDNALSDLAAMFSAYPEDPTPGHELLRSMRLDYSVQSLASVNRYLDQMRGRRLANEAAMKLRLRAGAYVGEVIRHNARSGTTWHWLDNKQALKVDPQIAQFGVSIETIAVLWEAKSGAFLFPVAKVGKYLENGAEDDLKFYADAIIAGAAAAR
jgi:hypothetical protein